MKTLEFMQLVISVDDLEPRAIVPDDDEMAGVMGGRGYYRRRRRWRARRQMAYFRHKVRMHRAQERRRMRSRTYRRAKRNKPSVLAAFKRARAQR